MCTSVSYLLVALKAGRRHDKGLAARRTMACASGWYDLGGLAAKTAALVDAGIDPWKAAGSIATLLESHPPVKAAFHWPGVIGKICASVTAAGHSGGFG